MIQTPNAAMFKSKVPIFHACPFLPRVLRCLAVGAALIMLAGGKLVSAQGKDTTTVKPIPGPGSTLSQNALASLPNAAPMPYGLALMARWDLLPTLRDTRCFQDSSYDPSGGNGDAGHYFRQEGRKAILSDITGPGCIYRFWSANASGHLQIFFDGETTPRIDCQMQDLFGGKVAPFVAPLVGHRSGGWYSFFPMPFQKSCRIEVTDPGNLYYHVQYQRFADNTAVRTFTPTLSGEDQAALQTVTAQWNGMGANPLAAPLANLSAYQAGTKTTSGSVSLPAGQTRTLTTLNGAGRVTALHLALVPADRVTLRQTLLRVYWDGAKQPGIESPVGDFFGVGFGDRRMASLPTAMQDSGYTCWWPMPFGHSARFELVNMGKTDLSAIAYRIESQRGGGITPNDGYFHAQWHRQTTKLGEPFHILAVKGRGHYVGEHTDMQGDHGLWFLEGDEKAYVDGETFPSIHGTGTEDFYTGGWYFDQGPFGLPYHGCVIKQDDISRVSAYRFQIQDCVPFQHDFKLDIEHGGTNDYPGADYSCVAYWYQDSATHDWSPILPAQLTPSHPMIEHALEAELLVWSGGKVTLLSDDALPVAGSANVEASGGKVAVVSGDKPTVTFEAPADDNYTLHLVTLNLPDNAPALNMSLDGSAYKNGASSAASGHADMSTFTRLTAGRHTLALDIPKGQRAYVDYLRLEPSRKEKGVIEGESLLPKVDGPGRTDATLADGNPRYSGGAALRWQPLKTGEFLSIPLVITQEANYTIEMAVDADDSSTAWSLQDEQGVIHAASLPANAKGVQKLRFGGIIHLASGAHTLVLKSADVRSALTLDYVRLVKTRYANSVEAETLKVIETQDGSAETQDMKGIGLDWSGDAQFWFHAQKPGSLATLELPVPAMGTYNLVVYYTTARDYGIVQTLIDGKEVGSPTDCYTTEVKAKGRVVLGSLDLTAGAHRITFRVTGKNAASSNYLVGVDAIGLEPK